MPGEADLVADFGCAFLDPSIRRIRKHFAADEGLDAAFFQKRHLLDAEMSGDTFVAWIYFKRTHNSDCSPNTIPKNPTRATIGDAGLFTRMTPCAAPTSRQTNKMTFFKTVTYNAAPIAANVGFKFRF